MFARSPATLRKPSTWGSCVLAVIGLLIADGTAHGGYEVRTFDITYSNTYADGVNYGTVQVESYDGVGASGGGLEAGRVKFTVTANRLPIYGDTSGQNFGWGSFAFNTLLNIDLQMGVNLVNLDPTATLHKNKSVEPTLDENRNYSQYGWFDWVLSWTPSTQQDYFSFEIDTGNDSLAHVANFVQLSRTSKDLNSAAAGDGMLYAGHIMGYGASPGSHKVGANAPPAVPAPPTVILAGIGMLGFGGWARLRRKFAAAA
ncbi:MAG TPA: hypothetical protein VM533_13520 [Fimbriiglobus sp.]|jgi:hypothetical protein|nr:hypothetical protein [Fimbriiglobus sp.]